MQRQLLLLVIFILSVSVSFSQHHPISQQLQQLKQRQSATAFCPLVAPKSIAAAAHIQKMLKKATLLHMDDNQWNDMRQMSAELVEIEIPIDTHSSIVLELFKKNIFSPKWQYKNKDGQPLSIQKGLHYRGIVQGDPSSIVAISLVGKKLMGLISSPVLGNLVIGQLNDGSERYILYKDSDRYEQNPMNCHADLLPTDATTVLHPHAQYSKSSCGKVIDIYFEADHVFYQAAGNSEQNVINYLAGLFNIVATLFQRESIAVRISEVKVWTTPDPYPTSRADDALIKFRETLNGSFNGDAAQLLSLYRDENGVTSNGGLAFIDQLCNNKALSVGYSNIDGGYNLLPAYSWDVFLVTHEFGHTFGSPHTHACKWGPDGTQSLDNCFETEGNCSPGPTPTTGGTIMSYCHLTTQGIDMSNGFGEVPGDLIRNRVATASCLAIGSDDFTASINTMGETVLASGDTLLLFASPDDNSYVYQWYKNDERLDDAVQAFYRASTPGEYAVEISRNGCTERAAITVEEQTLAVNFSCVPSNCTTCIGKSIVIDAGVEATNYNWSTGENTRQIEVFGAGDYTVTVTRSGDSATATTSVQFTQLSRTDEVDICEGETYAVGNSTYTTSGTYTDILTTADGCREEVTTVLTVYPTDESFDIITICQGESIRVGDSVYTESGNYTNTVTDENGCESRINTMLTVAPTYRTDQQVSICEGGEHVVGNNAYTVAGTYEITLTSSDNCDSTIVLQLAVAENYRIEQSIQRCEGEQITVGNNIYTTTGVYEDMLIASDGCDSLVITDLVVYPHQEQFISRVICAGEQVQIGSSIYTSTGQYEDILTSAQGCDSIIQTQVTVLPSSTTQQTFDGCEGDQITVGNSTYDTSGTYTDILTAVNGCDSTVTTQVTISDEIRVEEQLDLCYGAIYNGEVQTENRIITTTGISTSGCDSVYLLNIRVGTPIAINFTIEDVSCTSERGAIRANVSGGTGDYTFLWNNGQSTANLLNVPVGSYELLVTDSNGCTHTEQVQVRNESDIQLTGTITPVSCRNRRDASIDMMITSGMPPFTIFWSNGPLTEDQDNIGAGSYSVTVTDANDCKFDTTFVIANPVTLVATTTATNTQTDMPTGTASVNISGGMPPYSHTWDTGDTTATITNLAAGTYDVVVTDANGCTTTAFAVIDVVSSVIEQEYVQQFDLFPNPNSGRFQISLVLRHTQASSLSVFNAVGQQIQQIPLANTNRIEQSVQLDVIQAGVYWLVVQTAEGKISRRFVVY